ncbi:thrombospondin type-1 domain-containing protein 4-like [Herpailurus yagouaroundi]|uniref:thrombospondin type-1 domain-containing protein 4-like n=1 Tax=Herpailurus yagouaroundi TaxID=1608482 RepID=UPI001AD6CE36|nr:thrombospondin type-1 domain-containing protein 4-like [Puma yagouaroundi]
MDHSIWVNMKLPVTLFLSSCVSFFRSRTRGPIGPGKYGYGKAPYILPLQTDSEHSPQRLRRQRPSARHSRSQGASGPSHGYGLSAHRAPQHGPLYQSDSGPRSGLQTSEASLYQMPLTHDGGFPAASSLFHGPEISSGRGMGAHGAAQSFSQPARSTAISCIGAYRQYKLCNTNVCPESSRSIREVQCASYNNKPFMGRFYEWEPFAEAGRRINRIKTMRKPLFNTLANRNYLLTLAIMGSYEAAEGETRCAH